MSESESSDSVSFEIDESEESREIGNEIYSSNEIRASFHDGENVFRRFSNQGGRLEDMDENEGTNDEEVFRTLPQAAQKKLKDRKRVKLHDLYFPIHLGMTSSSLLYGHYINQYILEQRIDKVINYQFSRGIFIY